FTGGCFALGVERHSALTIQRSAGTKRRGFGTYPANLSFRAKRGIRCFRTMAKADSRLRSEVVTFSFLMSEDVDGGEYPIRPVILSAAARRVYPSRECKARSRRIPRMFPVTMPPQGVLTRHAVPAGFGFIKFVSCNARR